MQTDELNSTPGRGLSAGETVESDITASEIISTEAPAEPHISDMPTVPLTPLPIKREFHFNWWSVIALTLAVILLGEHIAPVIIAAIDGYLHPKATVTLFAAHQQQEYTYVFLAVTGTPDQSQNQVRSRLVSFTTPTKNISIQTTGVAYTPATQATGSVTFYNEAPYSQSIAAGTVLTGTDGVQIVTDQTAVIQAGNAPALGIATVTTHALIGGTKGNIQALDVNGLCCLGGILVKNTAAFTGGEDPQSYPTVSKADLQLATQELAITLDSLAKNGLKSQIAETERPLTSIECSYTNASTPKVGMRATTAIVSVSEQCNMQVYDFTAVQMQASLLFSQDAGKHTGSNFLLSGNPTVTLGKVTLLDSKQHTYKIFVTATGTMIFHLSDAAVHSLVTQIAGEKITVAQHQLLAIQGIQGVYIKPANPGESVLPAATNQIQIVLS